MKIIILARETQHLEGENDTYGRENIDDALGVKKALSDLHEVKILSVNEESYPKLKEEKPDVVFNLGDDGFRGDPRLEPHVAAILDILNIPYTGNNYFSLALCQNKARAKEILAYHGILTPKFQVFSSTSRKINPELKFPLIVKPVREDGSIGIKERSVVSSEEQLKEQVEHILAVYKQEALVEEFIDGREFNVAVIGNKRLVVLPVAEIDFTEMPKNAPKIVSYRAKWVKQSLVFKKTPVTCPAAIDENLAGAIAETAKKCYKIFGCSGYGRVDFRYDEKENKLYVLEVNPNPDISEEAGISKAARAAGISYRDLILRIIDYAVKKES
jgi:D-alanine-D-alanine ligase